MALRENSAHPGQNRAAPVEVFEQRAAAAVAHLEPIEVGPDRVGELAPTRLVAGDRSRGGIQRRSQARDEMFPGARVSALARERE